jgi:signal-transduction protein with cAMP-binding, CBS, and nucleotidyltransferase domain
MMKVSDILKTKGSDVKRIHAESPMIDAVRKLVDENIGALLVLDADETIVGIVTERDVLRECARRYEALGETRVSEVMTRNLIIGTPEDDLDYVQAVMTNNHLRHLPIVSDGKLHGLISIGDVVKVLHHETQVENRDLKEFISLKYVG